MRIHHLALRTSDPERLLAFYCALLGLRVCRARADGGAWLELDGAVLMIERAGDGEPGPDPRGLDLLAFRVDAAERDALALRLLAAGVVIEARTAHTLYFRDPDGRRVGLSDHPLSRDG